MIGTRTAFATFQSRQSSYHAIDRYACITARAHSHIIFHRCLAALRNVQTGRGIRCQAFPDSGPLPGLGLMDFLQVSKVKPFDQTAQPGPASPQSALTERDAAPDAGMDALIALAEQQIARRFREQGLAGLTSVVPTPTPGNRTPGARRNGFEL